MAKISMEKRGRIIALWHEGWRNSEIAEHLEIDQKSVWRWIRRYRIGGPRSLTNVKQPGAPRKLNNQAIENLEQAVRETPFCSSNELKQRLNLDVSALTIRRRLNEAGLFCRKPAKKIDLQPVHVRSRINFCNTYAEQNWTNVIFSDEKTFSSSEDIKKPLWRPKNTRLHPNHVAPVTRSGRLSIGFWGWMSSWGPGELIEISAKMDATQYIEILEEVMLPSVRTLFPDGNITFVQDNSAVHTARIVKSWFEEHPDVSVVEWPAKSPDLNPIENVWSEMIRKRENQIRNKQDLRQHVFRVWEDMRGTDYCENLVNSMPRRMQQVLDNNGYWTKY